MKVFLFAIGGTGARVLRSFTMLLASGIKVNKDDIHAYMPMKIGMGYDNGVFTTGGFYQHNFVIGAKDDNIFGITAGLKF